MRKVLHARNQWAVLAGLPMKSVPSDENGVQDFAPLLRPSPDTLRRRPALTLVSTTPAFV
jgi:hypothetical protein